MNNRKALVVLSGGQDSTTCLAMAVAAFGAANVHAITFNYGQRHDREVVAAVNVAQLCGVSDRHEILHVGNILAGRSPLTDHSQALEQYRDYESMGKIIGDRVELTFVPLRNALFLTLAANRAAVLECSSIYTGVCQQDNANYPDCRVTFIRAQQHAINEALGFSAIDRRQIHIVTPLMDMSKATSIKVLESMGLLHLLAFSHTAYDGQYPPLGRDHATVLREQGFLEAGVPDPLLVRAWLEGLMPYPTGPNYVGDWAHLNGQDLIDRIKRGRDVLGFEELGGFTRKNLEAALQEGPTGTEIA